MEIQIPDAQIPESCEYWTYVSDNQMVRPYIYQNNLNTGLNCLFCMYILKCLILQGESIQTSLLSIQIDKYETCFSNDSRAIQLPNNLLLFTNIKTLKILILDKSIYQLPTVMHSMCLCFIKRTFSVISSRT